MMGDFDAAVALAVALVVPFAFGRVVSVVVIGYPRN
jgi:hypothetical protein